jgi:hypothetical protein
MECVALAACHAASICALEWFLEAPARGQPMTPPERAQLQQVIAKIRALPRYVESEVVERSSMHEWIDADELELLLSALIAEGPSQPNELNAWRELGDEMGRVISFLSREQYEDLFPDWFGPRLFDLQVRAAVPRSAPATAEENSK